MAQQKFDGLNYKQAQKRNSIEFSKWNSTQQKQIRKEGYKNIGWEDVRKSWVILQNFIAEIEEKKDNVVDLYSYKVAKGNMTAIDAIDAAILQTEVLIAKGKALSKNLLSKLR